jgi:hypothetical protein
MLFFLFWKSMSDLTVEMMFGAPRARPAPVEAVVLPFAPIKPRRNRKKKVD